MSIVKRLLIFLLVCSSARAATITGTHTNSAGVADTNWFLLRPISTPIAANGSWVITGVPVRIYPNSSGFWSTNLAQGNYNASNAFLVNQFGGNLGTSRGLIFAAPDSVGTFNFLSNVISGANVFNYNGAQFVATSANIISALGYTPLTAAQTTNAVRSVSSTNYIIAGSNITLTSTNAGGGITITATSTGGSGTNTVSRGNTLIQVTTNGNNYSVSTSAQTNSSFVRDIQLVAATNSFLLTNDTHSYSLSGVGHLGAVNVTALTNVGSLFQTGDANITGDLMVDGITASGTIATTDEFQGNGALLTHLNASELSAGTVPLARISGLTSNQFDIVTYSTATNRNGGTALTTTNVLAAVTNRWRLDDTNAITGYAQPLWRADIPVYAPVTNSITPGRAITLTTNAGATAPITVATYASTNFLLAGSGITLTSTNAAGGITVTSTGGGSGTGIQTNNGAGSGNTFTNASFFGTTMNSAADTVTFTGTGNLIGTLFNIVSIGSGHSIGSGTGSVTFGRANQQGANASYSTISGGTANNISNGVGSRGEVIAGGDSNTMSTASIGGVISGGELNSVAGSWSTVLGGYSNYIAGNYSMAAGKLASTTNNNVFIWSDGTVFPSITNAEFAIAATNGVRVVGPMQVSKTFTVATNPVFDITATNITLIGAGSSIVNQGAYRRVSTFIWTNVWNGLHITNNSGTFIVRGGGVDYYSSTALVTETAWTILSGAASGPASRLALDINENALVHYGVITSTNLDWKITNALSAAFNPLNTVGVYSPTNAIHVAKSGNDTNSGTFAFPRLTLTSAKQLATNGQTIVVWPGVYAENNLLKNRVNWHFMNGAQVTYSNGTSFVGIFYDGGNAITSNITGDGDFTLTYSAAQIGPGGTVHLNNTNTLLNLEGNSITLIQPTGGNDGDKGALEITACRAATFNIHSFIDNPSDGGNWAIGWNVGELHINCPVIRGNGFNTIYCEQDGATAATSMYINADLIDNQNSTPNSDPSQACIWAYGISSFQRTWINAREIHSLNGCAIDMGYGRMYVTAQKVSTDSTVASAIVEACYGTIDAGTEFKGWLNIGKVSAKYRFVECADETIANPSDPSILGEYYYNVQHFDDTSGGTMTNGFKLSFKTNYFSGQTINSAGTGISVRGGLQRFDGYTINAQLPARVSTNGLILKNCVLVASGNFAITNGNTAGNTVAGYSLYGNKSNTTTVVVSPGSYTTNALTR